MPESTDAGNGQWGRIEFGFITFSLQDLNKALDVDSDSAEKQDGLAPMCSNTKSPKEDRCRVW